MLFFKQSGFRLYIKFTRDFSVKSGKKAISNICGSPKNLLLIRIKSIKWLKFGSIFIIFCFD